MRLLLIFLLFPVLSFADCRTVATTDPSCITSHQWQVRVGFGLGHRSNPLVSGRNFPYWIMPDISYYANHWFFDNGTLGYSWTLSPTLQLSLLSRLNEEKGYFRRAHPSNFFTQSMTNSIRFSGPMLQTEAMPAVSIDEVSKRPTALDAGLQLDWFLPHVQVKANFWQDISQQYHGQHASLTLQRGWQHTSGFWQLSGSVLWKSSKLMQTYYGLDVNDQVAAFYQPNASWQSELKFSWTYPLSERWSSVVFYRYRWLDQPMIDSPLVQESSIRGWFLGLSYQLL